MLQGELMEQKTLSGSIEKEVIGVGGGSSNIDSISVDGVTIEPDDNKNVNINLSGKVDKITQETTTPQVYAKDKDGSQTMLNAVQYYSEDRNGLARFINGNLIVNTPTEGAHATHKKYVDDNFVKQQNLSDTDALPYYAYVRTKKTIDGEQKEIDDKLGITQWGASPYTLAQRTNSGALIVGTPTANNEATPKKYVDDNFVAKNKRLTGNRVYASQSSKDADGNDVFTDNTIGYATGEQASTLALRGAGGTLAVGSPTQSAHATTKQYVDDKFAGQGTVTAGKSPQYTNDGNIAVGDARYGYEAVKKSYVDDKFNGANKAVSFVNYSSMITSLNALGNTSYSVGQNIMIVTLEVPDLWVSEIAETSIAYTYVSDDYFVNELNTNGSVQVGYYKLSALETQKVDLTEYVKKSGDIMDGQLAVNIGKGIKTNLGAGSFFFGEYGRNVLGWDYNLSTDVTSPALLIGDAGQKINLQLADDLPYINGSLDYVKTLVKEGLTTNTEEWTDEEKKKARTLIGATNLNTHQNYGVQNNSSGLVMIAKATDDEIKNRSTTYKPIVPANFDYAMSTNYLFGESAPTTETKAPFIGALYVDTTNLKTYQCTAIDSTNNTYTWSQLIRSTDYAGNSVKGVVDVRATFGLQTDQYARIQTVKATDDEIEKRTSDYHVIVPTNLDFAVTQALIGKATETTAEDGTVTTTYEHPVTLSEDEKTSARELIGSASTDIADNTYNNGTGKYDGTAGLFMFDGGGKGGLFKSTTGGDGTDRFRIKKATFSQIDSRTPSTYHDAGVDGANHCCPITPANIDYAVKQALTNDKLNGYIYDNVDYSWTDEEKAQARSFLGIEGGSGGLSIKSEVLTVDNAYTRLTELTSNGKFFRLIYTWNASVVNRIEGTTCTQDLSTGAITTSVYQGGGVNTNHKKVYTEFLTSPTQLNFQEGLNALVIRSNDILISARNQTISDNKLITSYAFGSIISWFNNNYCTLTVEYFE